MSPGGPQSPHIRTHHWHAVGGQPTPAVGRPAKRPVGGSAVDTTVAPAGLASHLPAVGGPEGAKKRRRSQGNSKSSAHGAAADGKQPKQAASKVARNDSAKDAASSGTKSGGRESPQSSDAVAASGHEKEAAKSYDKYCHFCQHVKINMLACTTVGCTHRYCVYCLGVHLRDDTEPSTSTAWTEGSWKCPTCRSVCCCSTPECSHQHRHCKAFRYRLRRADAANMRATAAHALVSLAALGGTGPPVTETAGKASGAARSKGGKGSNQRSKGPSASASGQGKSKGDAVCASAVAGGAGAAAGASLFTEAGDVVPLKVSMAASKGATVGGGATSSLLEMAHLDLEKLRMPTTRPADRKSVV